MRRVDRDITSAAFLLGIVEALLTTAAVCISVIYVTGRQASFAAVGFAVSISVVAIIIAAMRLSGLYGVDQLVNFRAAFWRLALVTGIVFALAVITTGLLAKNDIVAIYPYRWQWTLALTAIWLLCVLGSRMFLKRLIENGYFVRRILAVADTAGSTRLNNLVVGLPGRVVVAANLNYANTAFDTKLAALSSRIDAPEIVVAAAGADGFPLSRKTFPVSITEYEMFYERETGRVDAETLAGGWLASARGPNAGIFEKVYRRCFDVAIALIAFALVAPVMLLVALAIRIEDGHPILFRQTRVGLKGREFTLFKFRSMRVDAEDGLAPLWAANNDPRITRVGSLIRKLRIDELPQFFNVLRGDMSFIGPRPERPYFVQQLAEIIPFYNDRHCVRPGITGWAQVSFHYGASIEDARHKTAFDLYYVKHRSVTLDLLIVLRTVKVVLWPQGVR